MIDVISLETAHLLGDALPSAHRLRHRIFIGRQKYAVSSHRGMEWDQFDTPAAVYMLWRDEAKQARAIARLIPTSQPYMIQQLWPELITDGELPSRDDVWEITRFGIDRDLDRERRARVFGELFCALGEFGLKTGISAYIFVTSAALIDSALRGAGVAVQQLGKLTQCGRPPMIAARSPVSYTALHNLRRHYRISGPVLQLAGDVASHAA
jgi:N-acyl-L-homoserine lactone synthetase